MDMDAWFAPLRFRRMDDIQLEYRHRISVDDLIRRALSLSITSPAVLGARRTAFEAAMRSALEPFAGADGEIEDNGVAKATVFADLYTPASGSTERRV